MYLLECKIYQYEEKHEAPGTLNKKKQVNETLVTHNGLLKECI
jgi:hypothetical protein